MDRITEQMKLLDTEEREIIKNPDTDPEKRKAQEQRLRAINLKRYSLGNSRAKVVANPGIELDAELNPIVPNAGFNPKTGRYVLPNTSTIMPSESAISYEQSQKDAA